MLNALTGEAVGRTKCDHKCSAACDPRKPLSHAGALRRPAIDPLLLAASLTSNPKMTRHHFYHTFSGDASAHGVSRQMPVSQRLRCAGQCELNKAAPGNDMQHPVPAAKSPPPAYPFPSQQAPYSVRMQRKREQEELQREQQRRAAAGATGDSTMAPLEVSCLGRTRVPTPHGEIFVYLYRNNRDNNLKI